MTPPVYKGLKLLHNLESIELIKKIIKEFNPQLIMEIGTAFGGLTLVFHESSPNAEIHTYDPFRKPTDISLFSSNVHFHNDDVFNSNLYDICKSQKRKFLFCDGINKKKEMITFGSLLNSGDMLGVHDYPTRLWKDWIKGCDTKKLKPIIDPMIEIFLEEFNYIKENKEFEKRQKKIHDNNDFSDRYWIKK